MTVFINAGSKLVLVTFWCDDNITPKPAPQKQLPHTTQTCSKHPKHARHTTDKSQTPDSVYNLSTKLLSWTAWTSSAILSTKKHCARLDFHNARAPSGVKRPQQTDNAFTHHSFSHLFIHLLILHRYNFPIVGRAISDIAFAARLHATIAFVLRNSRSDCLGYEDEKATTARLVFETKASVSPRLSQP